VAWTAVRADLVVVDVAELGVGAEATALDASGGVLAQPCASERVRRAATAINGFIDVSLVLPEPG